MEACVTSEFKYLQKSQKWMLKGVLNKLVINGTESLAVMGGGGIYLKVFAWKEKNLAWNICKLTEQAVDPESCW